MDNKPAINANIKPEILEKIIEKYGEENIEIFQPDEPVELLDSSGKGTGICI
jgi:hypothetical protein